MSVDEMMINVNTHKEHSEVSYQRCLRSGTKNGAPHSALRMSRGLPLYEVSLSRDMYNCTHNSQTAGNQPT